MDQQSRYIKDETGFNPSNLVKAEPHYLTQQVKNRVVVPREGSFYSNSVTLLDSFKNKNLIKGKDFICMGLRVDLTRELGQEICSFVVITNDEVSHSISITYQSVGNEAQSLSVPAVETLEVDFSDSKDIPLYRIKNAPRKFEPTFHYQDLGDIDGFEYMLFSLEKIRNAIIFDSKTVYAYITNFDEYLNRLYETSTNFFQADLYSKMKSYTERFKKDFYGLALVDNLPPFLKEDGAYIAGSPIKLFGSNEEAYLTLEALSTYTKKLYELLVNIEQTGIGSSTEFKVPATVDKFEGLPIGSQFTIGNYTFSSTSPSPLFELFYPDRLDLTTSYVVKKITSSTLVNGSVFLYIGKENSKTFVMRLTKIETGYISKFTRIADVNNFPSILSEIDAHIEDKNNPHLDDKRDVDLAQVENLPLATMEDIICNMPTRKYITLTQLFSYMKRFKTGKKEISEIYENFSERTIGKRFQTLFSPCGAWDDNVDVDKIEMCKPRHVETDPPTTTTRAPATYEVVPSVTTLKNGETVTFDITTTEVDNDTVLYWSALLEDVLASRFVNTSLLGEVTIVDNKASVSLELKPDIDDGVPITLPPIVEPQFDLYFLIPERTSFIETSFGDTINVELLGYFFKPNSLLKLRVFCYKFEGDFEEIQMISTVSVTTDEDGSFSYITDFALPETDNTIFFRLPTTLLGYAEYEDPPFNEYYTNMVTMGLKQEV